MSNRTDLTYTNAPPDIAESLARSVRVADDLPSPAELAGWAEKQRVTILIDRPVVDFFKAEADAHGVKYQTMINALLGSYVAAHGAR